MARSRSSRSSKVQNRSDGNSSPGATEKPFLLLITSGAMTCRNDSRGNVRPYGRQNPSESFIAAPYTRSGKSVLRLVSGGTPLRRLQLLPSGLQPQPLLRRRPSSPCQRTEPVHDASAPPFPISKDVSCFPLKLSLWTKPFDIRYKKMAQNPCLARTWRLGGDETIGRSPRIRKVPSRSICFATGASRLESFSEAVAYGPATSSRS